MSWGKPGAYINLKATLSYTYTVAIFDKDVDKYILKKYKGSVNLIFIKTTMLLK